MRTLADAFNLWSTPEKVDYEHPETKQPVRPWALAEALRVACGDGVEWCLRGWRCVLIDSRVSRAVDRQVETTKTMRLEEVPAVLIILLGRYGAPPGAPGGALSALTRTLTRTRATV